MEDQTCKHIWLPLEEKTTSYDYRGVYDEGQKYSIKEVVQVFCQKCLEKSQI